MDSEKNHARVYVKQDGTLYRLHRVHKMVRKFRDMNFLEQQSFLMTIQKDLKPKPTKKHTYHFFISKRGKPLNSEK